MNIITEFFGNTKKVKTQISEAIQQGRREKGYTTTKLDEICGFGKKGTPFSSEVETNPDLLNGRFFCRASFPLDLKLDSILKLNLSDDQIANVVKEMEAEGAHVTAACGGGDVGKIPLPSQVPVYIYLKVIQALDSPVA